MNLNSIGMFQAQGSAAEIDVEEDTRSKNFLYDNAIEEEKEPRAMSRHKARAGRRFGGNRIHSNDFDTKSMRNRFFAMQSPNNFLSEDVRPAARGRLRNDREFFRRTHSPTTDQFYRTHQIGFSGLKAMPQLYLDKISLQCNQKAGAMAMVEKDQVTMAMNNRSIKGIKHELIKDQKERSIEVTTAAKKVVKKLVKKAQGELQPTQEEITGLYAELERDAKFNPVAKDLKTIGKMEKIKDRQMGKWREEFADFMVRKRKERIQEKRLMRHPSIKKRAEKRERDLSRGGAWAQAKDKR